MTQSASTFDVLPTEAQIDALIACGAVEVRVSDPKSREKARKVILERFDLISSDYLMPGGGGREILRFLQEHGRSPATIMITGLADEQLFSELTTQGVDRCLSKPFRLATLLETIEEVMADRTCQ